MQRKTLVVASSAHELDGGEMKMMLVVVSVKHDAKQTELRKDYSIGQPAEYCGCGFISVKPNSAQMYYKLLTAVVWVGVVRNILCGAPLRKYSRKLIQHRRHF